MSNTKPISTDELIDMARGASIDPSLRENRELRRHPFSGQVAIVQYTPDGAKTLPLPAQGKDISPGGMCILTKYMLHAHYVGAVLFTRSNDEHVLLGIQVAYSRYTNNGLHESGLMFNGVPDGIGIDDFRDSTGNLPVLNSRKAA